MHILITGAASGLGRGLALHFAAQNHHLALLDQNAAGLEETLALLPNKKHHTLHPINLTNAQEIKSLFTRFDRNPIQILINNAGLQHVSPLENFPEEKWDLLLDVMLKAPFLLTQAALPAMKKQNFGRIINIGSIHSLVASPYKSAYIAAKHGLLGLAKTVALEVGPADITINTICPAYVRTPLVDAQIAAQANANNMSEQDVIQKIMLEPMPKKAFITIEEVAGTAEFLISPAARNITAQTITLDGGWTAR
jgi:3-hydroxybutyrate dehydrogenase